MKIHFIFQTKTHFKIFLVFLFNFISPVWTSMYSGSWCPYKIQKSIPCRIQNGTESYLGPNLCWTSSNGSHVCNKRIQYRPRFAITYKKIWETRYKCCPGLEGPECQDECFNCSTLHNIERRMKEFEGIVWKLQPNQLGRWTNTIVENQVYTSKNDLIELEIRLAALATNYRELDGRLRSVETQLSHLIRSIDAMTKSNIDIHKKKSEEIGEDYNQKDSLIAASTSTSITSQNHREASTDAIKLKSHSYKSNQDYNQYSLSTQSLISADLATSTSSASTEKASLSSSPSSHPPEQSTPTFIVNNSKDTIRMIDTTSQLSTEQKNQDEPKLNVNRQQMPVFRTLEENLDRGDIASTLNDDEDYDDEELLSKKDFTNEEYTDQLLGTVYENVR